MKTFLLLLVGVVIGAFGLYAYQDPGVRYDVSQFIKGIGDLAFDADAPTPTMTSLAVAALSPTAAIPATHTPAPMAIQTHIPTPLATSVPTPIPIPTATAVHVIVPTPRPAAYSVEVVSAKSLGDGQVDFVLSVANVGGLATEGASEVWMTIDREPPELVNIIGALSPGESSSFAFIRALDPGRRVLTFMVGDFTTTVSVNIESEVGGVLALAPTPTVMPTPEPTPTLVPTYTPTRTPTPARATPTPVYIYVVPTPAPVSPTPSPTPTAISGDSQNEFFKSLKDLARESDLSQPEIEIEVLESLVHNLINQERAKQGLAILQWDGEIVAIARSHSQDMADKNYFSHVNPEGKDATDRGSSAGYDCVKVYDGYYTFGLAENIHQGWLFSSTTYINGVARHNWNSQADISEAAVNGWMRSQGHRKNILKDAYDRTGIGIAIAPDGKVFITQNFC